MTPEKQDKTLELSKHWSVDSTLARNEVIMKRTYPVKSVKCDKICSKKVYCVIMTSFFTKTLEILHKDLSYDCICPHQIWFSSDTGEQS